MKNTKMYHEFVCPFCVQPSDTRLYVHGHLQCPNCGKVMDDCCQGEVVDQDEKS